MLPPYRTQRPIHSPTFAFFLAKPTYTPNSPPCHLWLFSGCLFWFLFYTLAGFFLFTLLEIVFPPSPQCGFLTDTEAPEWLPQRASYNLALTQQDRCQEGGIKTAKQNTKRTKKKLQKKKSGLNFNSERKTKLICSLFSRASLRIVGTQSACGHPALDIKLRIKNNKQQQTPT